MIVRDAASTIEACLSSALPFVSELVVVDTGSLDDTRSIITRLALEHHVPLVLLETSPRSHPDLYLEDSPRACGPELPGPWSGEHILADFGRARQMGWQEARQRFRMWLDADDVLAGGAALARVCERIAGLRIDGALLPYNYSHDQHGKVICRLERERIIDRESTPAGWHYPVHEVICPLSTAVVMHEGVEISHGRHGPHPRRAFRNLKILRHWWRQNERNPQLDPRMLFYLGLEERPCLHDDAVGHLRMYLDRSRWAEERAVARYILGIENEMRGKINDAEAEYARGAFEHLANPDNVFALARLAFLRTHWQKCVDLTTYGQSLLSRDGSRVLMHDPLDRNFRPFVLATRAYAELGRTREAIASCKRALTADASDPGLAETLALYEGYERADLAKSESLAEAVIDLWRQNMDAGHFDRAVNLLDNLPSSVVCHPLVRDARQLTLDILPRNSDGLVVIPKRMPAKNLFDAISLTRLY